MKEFGKRLKNIIKSRGYTQSQFAELLSNKSIDETSSSLSVETIKKWCKGSAFPKHDNLILICDKLDIDSDYLLGRYEKTKRTINETTGLSQRAIDVLSASRNEKKNDNPHIKSLFYHNFSFKLLGNIISTLLTHSDGIDLLLAIYEYYTATDEDAEQSSLISIVNILGKAKRSTFSYPDKFKPII